MPRKIRHEWPREAVHEKQGPASPHRIFAERSANENRIKSSNAAERATGMASENRIQEQALDRRGEGQQALD